MAEIDTTAPFASVRDAVYMFGEHSHVKTQRAFPTTNALHLEKIHSLEVELYELREKHATATKQLSTADNTATEAFEKLSKIKHEFEENNRKAENVIAAKISSLESQLDAMLEQESKRTHEIENSKNEINHLYDELEVLKIQHKTTLVALKRSQEENDKLREHVARETNANLSHTHEHHVEEHCNIAAEQMKDLLEDLFPTENKNAKGVAHEKIEKQLLVFKDVGLETERDEPRHQNATVEMEKLIIELQAAEDKQEEIIMAVEKLKDELTSTKESEKKAIQAEVEAKFTLKRMKIEVEDSKVIKEKARMMAVQLEDMGLKFEKAVNEENTLLASLASLKAELKNSNNELYDVKKEADEIAIEMEEHIKQLQTDLNNATARETKTKECLLNLNEALQQVSAEGVEAKAAATQATKEVLFKTQELEEAMFHNKTLECHLEAAIKEMEAAKASEVFAHTEIKFLKKRNNNNMEVNRNGHEVTISYDEYETMIKKVVESEKLANKRIVASIAQVEASKASELEISKKLESVKHLLETNQIAMKHAIQVAEAAESAKSVVEGELRKWRSENEQRRKAAVAAVMAVGKNGTPIVIENIAYHQQTMNKSNGGLHNVNSNASQPKESLSQLLRYNYFPEEKIKKNLFSSKISSYFTKKIK